MLQAQIAQEAHKEKHVLDCEKDKSLKENTDLLEEYKAKCILNLNEKRKLPECSRRISFHSNSARTEEVRAPQEEKIKCNKKL